MENASGDELIVFAFSLALTAMFLWRWYSYVSRSWLPDRHTFARRILACLPVVSFAIILYTLMVWASFDVVDSVFFIAFYILLGYAWLWAGMIFMSYFFDLSWIDDILNLGNKAALPAIVGGFLGLTIIYSGANIGDGPGWWCVIFAGGMGLVAWILLGIGICRVDEVSERITVGRDLGCGIRFGFYMLASGIILGRASAGDWTSFGKTFVEFYDVYDRWPVLVLAVLEGLVERFYLHMSKARGGMSDSGTAVYSSVSWGVLYLAIAFMCIMAAPSLPKNPDYRGVTPQNNRTVTYSISPELKQELARLKELFDK